MRALTSLHATLFSPIERADWLLPTVARFLFAAVLLMYFWVSGLTKLDGGPFSLSFGGYAQIFPKAMEAVGYDITQLASWQHVVVYAGTYSEFILPILIVIGLLTRLAALGMIGFVVVQSLTDLFAHGALADPKVFGAWFDKASDSLIMDQRSLWVLLLLILVIKGAGPLSFDRALSPKNSNT
ncbi:MAG: DoxX family protein [Paracoccaceae bacterium]